MTLKSRMTNSKLSKTVYKGTEVEEGRFSELLAYLDSFCVSFYDRFKDLLAASSDNVHASP